MTGALLPALATCALLLAACVGAPECVDAQDDACRVGAPLALGNVPNAVTLVTCGPTLRAVVPVSAESRLDAVGVPPRLDAGSIAPSRTVSTFFDADSAGRFASPWAVASFATATGEPRVAVTLFGQHAVAVTAPCTGALQALWSDVDALPAVPLVPPLAVDDDGDGQMDRSVATMQPQNPEPIVVVSPGPPVRMAVAFTNLLSLGGGPDRPPVAGPGTVVLFELDGNALHVIASVNLPCINPQGLALDGGPAARLVVSCSGRLAQTHAGVAALDDGAVVILDAAALTLRRVVRFGHDAPGAIDVKDGRVLLGSLLAARVWQFGLEDEAAPGTAVAVADAGIDSIFAVRIVAPDLLLVAQFGADALHFLNRASVPLRAPLIIGNGPPVFSGLQGLALTDGFADRVTSTQAPGDRDVDAVALSGLSAQLWPLALGPLLAPLQEAP